MPPKSALLTAGDPSPAKKLSYGRKPISTQGKQAKAAADLEKKKKNVPREAPTDRQPKPKSVPPPGEALRAKNAAVGKKSSRSKPITTQQKQRAAAAKRKAMDPLGAAEKEQAAAAKAKSTDKGAGGSAIQSTAGGAQGGRARKEKPPGVGTVVKSQGSSTLRFAKKAGGDNAVMYRRTQKASKQLNEKRNAALNTEDGRKLWKSKDVRDLLKRAMGKPEQAVKLAEDDDDYKVVLAKLLAMGLLPAPGVLELTAVDLHGDKETFRFMEVPKELRLEIYSYVVIEQKVFVRPDCGGTGREQPDLAMVSKEIRAEVLALFYGKNTFAINLSPTMFDDDTKREVINNALVEDSKWARAMKLKDENLLDEDWFRCIRRWIFDYAPYVPGSRDHDESRSLMLSVRFIKDQSSKTWSAEVEVHRDAACIMPGFEEQGLCTVALTPDWVNALVIGVCDEAKGGSINANAILGLAKALKPRMAELVEDRCEAGKEIRIGRIGRIKAKSWDDDDFTSSWMASVDQPGAFL